MKNKTLSLQRKINLEKIYPIRNIMISEYKLHIQDLITYELFKELFSQYGEGLNEVDFARYFLDIDYRSYYNLQSGLRETTSILERQYYDYIYLDLLEQDFLFKTDLKLDDKIDYAELIDLHKKFGGFFSLKLFADEILGLNARAVDDMNLDGRLKKCILKKEKTNREEIFKIRDKIALETGYHTKSQISLEEFNELYKNYAISEMPDRIFALKVLGISSDTFVRFSKGKRPKVAIFPTFPINPKYISELREKVILKENLHIDDPISNEKFVYLYKKYGGVLTEELFAEEILDVSLESIRNSKRRKQNVYILGKIDIDDEWINIFKDGIVQENSLAPYKLLSLAQIRELYKKYPSVLSEKMFAVNVLMIPDYNYEQLTTGATFESKILVDKSEKDFQAIRERVIKENNLHYDDKIEYYELDRLHKLYAPTVQEHIFANKILDIPQEQLDNIRHDKGNAYTHILLSEPLPSKKELIKLKRIVIYNEKLHRKDSIDYKTFKKIYNTYGGIMPEDMFAEQILDILISGLKKIRTKPKEQLGKKVTIPKTQILLRTNMTTKEITELREQIFTENLLYPGKNILLKDAIEIYHKYQHILYPREFYRKVLHINGNNIESLDCENKSILEKKFVIGEADINAWKSDKPLSNSEIKQIKSYLFNNYTIEQIAGFLYRPLDKTEQLIDELSDKGVISIEKYRTEIIKKLYFDDKKTIAEIQEKTKIPSEEIKSIISKIKQDERLIKKKIREKQVFEAKSRKILEKFNYDSKNISIVNKYIQKCMELYKPEKCPDEILDFLGECIIFVQGGVNQIKFFAQACISHREYDKAYRFIAQNIENEGVQKTDKMVLIKLQRDLKYAKLQERVIDIFLNENVSPEVVAQRTGILLTDAIRLKRSLQHRKQKSEPQK